MEEFDAKNPTAPLLISFKPDEVRKQAAASTQRFEEGNWILHIFIFINGLISILP